MATNKKILIMGGGYSGVWAGKILEKHFRKNPNVQITLVDKKPFHTLMTELHEVAGWRTEPESVQVDFRKIFGARKIDIKLDEINKIDFIAKKAVGKAASYEFDYIIVGAGGEPEYFGIPGVQENCFSLWSFEDALAIRHHLEDMFAQAAAETDEAKRRQILTFVVAGAGFTGIEMIGELLEYRDVMCKKHHLNRAETRVINIEALPSIIPILEEPLRVKAEKYLKRKGCEIMLNTSIIGAEKGKVLCKGGAVIETDTFIWTCGVKGSVFSSELAVDKGERGRGRLQVDAEMKSPNFPFLYVVGDNSFFLENGKPVAQIVEGAHQTAEVAAKNIIADIEGVKARHQFKSNFHGFMVSLGGRYGVSNAGGMKTSGFIAMTMKHMINCLYLFNIAGFNQVWEYLKHEILDIQNRRSLIGGFATHKIRSYWAVLLRMYLGFSWFMEGLNKIGEHWLKWSEGSKSSWMFSKGVVQATLAKIAEAAPAIQAAADATSASSEWTEEAASAVAPVAAAVADATSASTEWVETAVPAVVEATTRAAGKFWDLTKPIFDFNGVIATWFRTTFMDGMASKLPFEYFQLMIVVVELGLGLAIFGGFFTWWAAAISIVMCVVFTLSGMFAWDQLWFVFAGILCLGGLGRAFGMDYWSVPFFKRWWNGTKFARRTHFYADDPSK